VFLFVLPCALAGASVIGSAARVDLPGAREAGGLVGFYRGPSRRIG